MKRMLNLVAYAIIALLICYVALVVLVYFNQERLVYFPARTLAGTPGTLGLDYEDVWLQTEDDVRLHGWFVPASEARGVALLFHGNGGNISSSLDMVALLHRLGMSSFLPDYRGYGLSDGTPGEQGTYHDALAAWNYLVEERQIASEEIVVIGCSLGGGVASWLVQRHPPGALILSSTFTSVPDVGAQHYPILPVRLLSRNRYPTLERLPQIEVPLLVSHSRDDFVIPFEHGQRLYAAAQEPKTFLPLDGAGHYGFAVHPAYVAGLDAFFDRALAPAAP